MSFASQLVGKLAQLFGVNQRTGGGMAVRAVGGTASQQVELSHDLTNTVLESKTGHLILTTPASKYIGFGTATPARLLEVKTPTTPGELSAVRFTHGGAAGNDNVAIEFLPAGGTLTMPAKITATAPGASDVDLLFVTVNGGTAGEVMRVTGDGAVGIGTVATPIDKLEIKGALNGTGLTLTSTTGAGVVVNRATTANNGVLTFQTAAVAKWNIGNLAEATDDLSINGGAAGLTRYVTILNASGNVGIGTASPNANAILDLTSTTKAFMPPRMTTAQRDAVAGPTAGMVVYNATTNKLNVYTTAWEAVTSA